MLAGVVYRGDVMGGRRFFAALSVCMTCFAMSCGDPESEAFAPGSWTAMHKSEIMRDCEQTVGCMVENDTLNTDLDDPIGSCLDNSAASLEDNHAKQAEFLTKMCRCSQ